ncbi:MAG: class I SAM-dependent methyltransferase [Acidobacteriota bacterium]|nr:class I SAM-dependent methyltransferase [Acidobacteriota bacterium]
MPSPIYTALKNAYRTVHRGCRKTLSALGLNVYPTRDFYSPLPVLSELEKTRELWDRPSEMVGVRYDLERMKTILGRCVESFGDEYEALPAYEENKKLGLGPGFTVIDAMTLYFMVRDLKPHRYIEIGSGFSTYYSWLAVQKNREEGVATSFRVVDPFPRDAMRELEGVSVEAKPAQEVPIDFFAELTAGDILFIDTTHVLKLGGELAYLFMEVIPRLKPGVTVHVHDIHFPYNVPYPAEQYVFRSKWGSFWTEAMLVQAFLAFNSDFEIYYSAPLLRYFCEDVLREKLPGYRSVELEDYDTHFSSLWFRRSV